MIPLTTPPNMTLFNLEATLMRLMFEREAIQDDPDLSSAEIEQALKDKDLEIREHVSAEIRKVDGVAYYLREFLERAATAKAESKRQIDRGRVWERRHERLESLVKSVMLMTGKSRLEGDSNTLRLVKNPPSVDIAQPELLPDEYRKITVKLPVDVWKELLRLAGSFEDVVAANITSQDWEPIKSKISETLKRQVPCERCEGTGFYTVPFELRLPGETASKACATCNMTGKVSRGGVPGARLVADKMSLRVE